MAMFKKESCIDTREDIAMIKIYLDEKLGCNQAECRRHTKYSKMTETELDPAQVGWSVMLQKEQKLRDWLANIIDKGELGAVGEVPPDLAAELGIDLDALDSEVDVDDMGAGEELGAIEVQVAADGQIGGRDDSSLSSEPEDSEKSTEESSEEEFVGDTPPHQSSGEEEEEEEELNEDFASVVSISPTTGAISPRCIIKMTWYDHLPWIMRIIFTIGIGALPLTDAPTCDREEDSSSSGDDIPLSKKVKVKATMSHKTSKPVAKVNLEPCLFFMPITTPPPRCLLQHPVGCRRTQMTTFH